MIAITLPMPPSVNNMFANTPKGRVRSRDYKAWATSAAWTLAAQNVASISGPVRLVYFFDEKKTRADLGNLEKAVTDLLVTQGVIDGDDKRTVRSIVLSWGSENGSECYATVTRAT